MVSIDERLKDFQSLFVSLKDFQGPNEWDTIVIGSGIGGLAAAAALAKCGERVLILEQHYIPGGFTHTFSRQGFTWDVGVHCMGEMRPKDVPARLLSWLTDDRLKMQSMGPVYETFYFPDGFKMEFPDTYEKFRVQLIERFPHEKAGIEKYFELVWQVSQAAKSYFALKIMPEWFDVLASKLRDPKKNYWQITTATVLNKLIRDEKLKSVLTGQWGYYGSTPSESCFAIHAMVVRHFWNGGYYPVGGAQSFAEELLKPVQQAGGAMVVRASVEEILVKNGKAVGVRMDGGREFAAEKIISAAGAKITANKLLPGDWRKSSWASEINTISQSPPHLCLNIGFEGDIEKVGATKSNQWFFNTWSCEDKYWDLSDENSVAPALYMSFPSLKDPLHEPGEKERHTGEVVTFVPWGAFEKWQETRRGKRTPDYRDFKKHVEERLIKQLERHIPELLKLVVYRELSTPLSTTFFTRAPEGAIYGLEATPKRFMCTKLRTRTPVKNLYLAGGDVATLGVTGALIGGVLAAGTIHKRILGKLI